MMWCYGWAIAVTACYSPLSVDWRFEESGIRDFFMETLSNEAQRHYFCFNCYHDVHSLAGRSAGLSESRGVPQGSVFGPLLFSVYSASLDTVMKAHDFPISVCCAASHPSSYRSKTGLQQCCTGWHLPVPSQWGTKSDPPRSLVEWAADLKLKTHHPQSLNHPKALNQLLLISLCANLVLHLLQLAFDDGRTLIMMEMHL